MNTIQRFERFKAPVFNAQDILKNHILQKKPVIYTDNTNDYSQATQYSTITSYVWLVDNSITLDSDFPLWFNPPVSHVGIAYEFPYVFKQTNNIKSWGLVKLVPTTGIVDTLERKFIVCSLYDVYNGHESFDKFFIGTQNDTTYKELVLTYPDIETVSSSKEAYARAKTDMFWLIPNNVRIVEDFKFDLLPSERAYDYPHVFGNGDLNDHSGIVLMSKLYTPSDKEFEHNFYVKKRIIKKVISMPA